MACIDLTDRRFELHYAANVVSNPSWFFFFLVSFFWQPVVQTSKLFSVLIKLACHCYGRGSGEAAYVHCRAALTSQGRMYLLWYILKRQRLSCLVWWYCPALLGLLAMWEGVVVISSLSVSMAFPCGGRGCSGAAGEVLTPLALLMWFVSILWCHMCFLNLCWL